MANTFQVTQSNTKTIVVRRIIYPQMNDFISFQDNSPTSSKKKNETQKGKGVKNSKKQSTKKFSKNTSTPKTKIKQNAKRQLLPCDKYEKGKCSNGILCSYMHQEFPCLLFYLGNKCQKKDCKFLHNEPLPLNILEALIKYAKTLILKNLLPYTPKLTKTDVEAIINRTQIELLRKKFVGIEYETLVNAQNNRPLEETLSFLSQKQLKQLKEMGVNNHYEAIMLNTWQLNILGITDGVLYQKIVDACLNISRSEDIEKDVEEPKNETTQYLSRNEDGSTSKLEIIYKMEITKETLKVAFQTNDEDVSVVPAGGRSPAWRGFEQICFRHEKTDYVRCKKCHNICKHTPKTGTTHLNRHLDACMGPENDESNQLQEDEHQLCRDQLSRAEMELEEIRKNHEETKKLLFLGNVKRKELHNNLMDLKGKIRVFCRVRPPLPTEKDKSLCSWDYIDEETVRLWNQNKTESQTFNFDYVFRPGCRQEDIFEMVSPLIQSAMDGYNICIFSYGQTGSGKTYTMDGIETNIGVIPRTVDLIFQSVENYKCWGWKYTIKATFLEIYNEVLYDLISKEQKDMQIRMVQNNRNKICVSNITEETVLTADHLRELIAIAKMNRTTAATIGNERSSRSHAVTRIELVGYHEDSKKMSVGTVNLVDLAGTESPKTSIRMNETKNINSSLSALSTVILALLQKQDHIPYRNSKLTYLLMPALGGNSKTLMFINIAPFSDCYNESVKSLRFAASVNSCKVPKAKRNRK